MKLMVLEILQDVYTSESIQGFGRLLDDAGNTVCCVDFVLLSKTDYPRNWKHRPDSIYMDGWQFKDIHDVDVERFTCGLMVSRIKEHASSNSNNV